MRIEKSWLWEPGKGVSFTRYSMENTSEIDAQRTYPALVICGGGGYLRNSSRERDPVALFFLNEGYQVFALDYRTKCDGDARYPGPVFDLAEMLYLIRSKAEEWNVNPGQVAVMGFSVGGHLCACLETQWNAPFLQDRYGEETPLLRPDAAVLCYPLVDYLYQLEQFEKDPDQNAFTSSKGMKKRDYLQVTLEAGVGVSATREQYRQASPLYHVSSQTPPTFLWHTLQDELVYAGQTLEYAKRLGECRVPYELHIFEEGPHGLVLADRRTAGNPELVSPDTAQWTGLCLRFLKRHLQL